MQHVGQLRVGPRLVTRRRLIIVAVAAAVVLAIVLPLVLVTSGGGHASNTKGSLASAGLPLAL